MTTLAKHFHNRISGLEKEAIKTAQSARKKLTIETQLGAFAVSVQVENRRTIQEHCHSRKVTVRLSWTPIDRKRTGQQKGPQIGAGQHPFPPRPRPQSYQRKPERRPGEAASENEDAHCHRYRTTRLAKKRKQRRRPVIAEGIHA